MIKAGGYHNGTGRTTVFLGLSEENVQRMKDGEPVFVHLDDVANVQVDVLIYGGRGDEEDLRAVLAEHARMPGEET